QPTVRTSDVEQRGTVSGDVDVELSHGIDGIRIERLGRCAARGSDFDALSAQLAEESGGNLGPACIVHADEKDARLVDRCRTHTRFAPSSEADGKNRGRAHSATYTRATRMGTSMRGPTTPASARPEATPQVPIATAMASSKLLPAAVNARVVVFS